jgi:solute:Na+ symporter, SSS family
VALLLLGYAGVSQFFPGIVLGLFWGRASRAGVFSGLVVGIMAVAFLILSGRDPFLGLNAGFAALILNLAVTVVVSLLNPSQGAVSIESAPS